MGVVEKEGSIVDDAFKGEEALEWSCPSGRDHFEMLKTGLTYGEEM